MGPRFRNVSPTLAAPFQGQQACRLNIGAQQFCLRFFAGQIPRKFQRGLAFGCIHTAIDGNYVAAHIRLRRFTGFRQAWQRRNPQAFTP